MLTQVKISSTICQNSLIIASLKNCYFEIKLHFLVSFFDQNRTNQVGFLLHSIMPRPNTKYISLKEAQQRNRPQGIVTMYQQEINEANLRREQERLAVYENSG